ncbi:MAG: glycosyltransferase family 2 protein, partial [Ilumatobacteraceae bacterium]
MTEGSAPAISVVIPTFNRLPRLKQVLGALSKQSLDNSLFEVVVVSDGSTDGTHEYLSGATPRPVVYAHQDNAGPGAARNRGVHLARGRLILFIDDDIVA